MVAVGVLLLQGVDPAGQPHEEFGEDGARVRVRRLPVIMQGVWRPVKNPHAGEQDAHVRRGEDEEQGPGKIMLEQIHDPMQFPDATHVLHKASAQAFTMATLNIPGCTQT